MFIKGKKYCCREGGFLDGSEERERKHRRERVIQKKRKEKKWNSYQDCFDLLVIDIVIVSTKVLRFFRFVVFLDFFSLYISTRTCPMLSTNTPLSMLLPPPSVQIN